MAQTGETKMRIAGVFLMLCVFTAARPLCAQDIVMKAMRDELDRSMKQLQLENLEKPYFISFRVMDSENANVSASFGALNNSSGGRSRSFTVEVRVGDYKLDNTNFYSPNFDMSSMVQVFNGTTQLPIEDDYGELRRQIWLATDATYKKAVEDLSKKRAGLQNKVNTDAIPDFTKEDPSSTTVDAPVVHADRAKWETLARSLSGLFRQMPDIYTSNISLSAANSYIRYLNSDGTSYTRRQPSVTFNAHAATQAPDGAPLDDFVWLYARSPAELPSADELASRVRALGQRLKDLRASSVIENYNGPVLAEGDAAAQLFRLVFVPNLLGSHQVLRDSAFGQQQAQQGENPFVDKIGARVLPEFLSVTDNPTLTEYNKIPLAGSCKVDEDGIPTRETRLVEKGILKTLLVTRSPVRGIEHSTGSRHAGGATPSNIFVTAENGLSAAQLRTKFLDLVKQRNKEFGIVVRRMRYAAAPVLAYKLFLDGREELIHGVQFAGLNASTFKEIVAASKDQNTLTVEFRPQRTMGMFSFGDEAYAPVTLSVPSLLFEDVTVRKVRGETPKPPVASHPYFDSK
jgi:predicted Zn-dependent protease